MADGKQTHAELEQAQAALRASIEQAKKLAEESDGLLHKRKQVLEAREAAERHEAYRRENPL